MRQPRGYHNGKLLEVADLAERVGGAVIVHPRIGMREHVPEASPCREARGEAAFQARRVGTVLQATGRALVRDEIVPTDDRDWHVA